MVTWTWSVSVLPPQFGSMLDENAGAKFDNIGMNAMANTDKAGEEHLNASPESTNIQHFNHEKEEILQWKPGESNIHLNMTEEALTFDWRTEQTSPSNWNYSLNLFEINHDVSDFVQFHIWTSRWSQNYWNENTFISSVCVGQQDTLWES